MEEHHNFQDDLYRAEGIYIIVVRDPESTKFASDGSSAAAYYDFYIRTCWYGTDADRPTTISTVVRLYDPNIIDKVDSSNSSVIHGSNEPLTIYYSADNANFSAYPWQKCSVYNEYTCLTISDQPTRPNYRFAGWATSQTGPAVFGSNTNVLGGLTVEQYVKNLKASNGNKKPQLTLYAVWRQDTLTYDFNGSTYGGNRYWTQVCGGSCQLRGDAPARSGYVFKGWSAYPGGPVAYQPGGHINMNGNTTIYAVWEQRNETITVRASFPYGDCDSHVEGQKSDGSSFHAYYGNKVGSDINGLVLASLDYDYTSGGTETFIINTLGGRNYYYYLHNYSGCDISRASVVVSGPYSGTHYYSPSGSYYGGDWHVFAYKDGQFVTGW